MSNEMITMDSMMELARTNQATADQLSGMVQQMGVYLMQLDARMRAQEELLSARVTITSAQSKRLSRMILSRAGELVARYELPSNARMLIRTAMRSDVYRRYGIKDLHDLPESRLDDAVGMVERWDSYRLIREIRSKLGL